MYVCVYLGVVSWDSGCGVPGAFLFARTLLFGTINPNYLENNITNITNKTKTREATTNNNDDINNTNKNKRKANNNQKQQHGKRTNKYTTTSKK